MMKGMKYQMDFFLFLSGIEDAMLLCLVSISVMLQSKCRRAKSANVWLVLGAFNLVVQEKEVPPAFSWIMSLAFFFTFVLQAGHRMFGSTSFFHCSDRMTQPQFLRSVAFWCVIAFWDTQHTMFPGSPNVTEASQ